MKTCSLANPVSKPSRIRLGSPQTDSQTLLVSSLRIRLRFHEFLATVTGKPSKVYLLGVSPFRESTESNSVVEVEFWTDDSTYPLVELSKVTNCKIVLEQLMPGKESGYYSYYQITGVSPHKIDDTLQNYEGIDTRLVHGDDEGGLFEIRINDRNRFFAPLLTEAGALLSQLWTVDGEAHLLVQVPGDTSSSRIIDLVLDAHPTVEVIAQRQKTYSVPIFTQELFQEAVYEELTERQRDVLFAAYTNGYFESPRRKSGEEIAANLDISSPTFSQHLRAAEHKIFTLLF